MTDTVAGAPRDGAEPRSLTKARSCDLCCRIWKPARNKIAFFVVQVRSVLSALDPRWSGMRCPQRLSAYQIANPPLKSSARSRYF
jgi:hypothetical protein